MTYAERPSKKFWRRVRRCKHKRMSPNYYADLHCPLGEGICSCGGESHCLDCGAYIVDQTDCPCGNNVGMSGWPHARWRARYRKAGVNIG